AKQCQVQRDYLYHTNIDGIPIFALSNESKAGWTASFRVKMKKDNLITNEEYNVYYYGIQYRSPDQEGKFPC
ncbi:MAG TPA: hypothetical protein O0X32_03640, partial [Methanocorpusculum sp.]|nr:hypothetical protein [Methanocorpusculum sp.]